MSDARLTGAAPAQDAGKLAMAVPALLAAVLGAFLMIGTGFVPIDAIHNAAHDTRHSFAFPCH